jgi:hypothetical protein
MDNVRLSFDHGPLLVLWNFKLFWEYENFGLRRFIMNVDGVIALCHLMSSYSASGLRFIPAGPTAMGGAIRQLYFGRPLKQ